MYLPATAGSARFPRVPGGADPDTLWATVSPAAQAAVRGVIAALQERIDGLRAEVAGLRDRVNRDSSNSSEPRT
jgi:hypothetical protein